MGIDFDNSNAHWSYSGFMHFRKRLAEAVGFDLEQMTGFDGKGDWDTITDNIKPLLNHSDCDGDLSSEECLLVGTRLKEIISDWPDGDFDKSEGLEFAEDMLICHKNKTSLEFI